MTAKPPRKHHYVPQFYLRNFATDSRKLTVQAVAKHGARAIWGEKEIRGIGYQEDFYVHTVNGSPFSVETHLNRTLETPIAESDTWAKISSGQTVVPPFLAGLRGGKRSCGHCQLLHWSNAA